MKKIVLILTILAMISFCFIGEDVYAINTTPDKINVYIIDISPKNLTAGEFVKGTIKIEVTCSGDSSVEALPSIDFGDTIESLGRVCHCFTSTLFGLSGEPRTVNCDFDFSHTYNSAGTYSVVPSVSWGPGGVGPVAGGGRKLGPSETVTVLEEATTAPATDVWNPLMATTTGGVVTSVTNIIFYIISALAVLLVMIGGFIILTAGGSPTQLAKGKKIIIFTIVGYAIMAISRGIIALIYKMLGMNINP